MTEKKLDCFGWLFDENLIACRDRCEVNTECQAQCKKNLSAAGPEKYEQKQKSLIMATEAEHREEQNAAQVVAVEAQSALVTEIAEFCNSMGLKGIHRSGYIAFKHYAKTLFKISRVKSKKVYGLIKFVNIREYKQFPKEIIAGVSLKPCDSGYHFSIVETVSELKLLLANYIEIFKEPLE